MPSKSPLFRRQALEHYVQSREKNILPRLARPPVFLLLWMLLSLTGVTLIVAWFGRVPVYIGGSGIVIEHNIIQNRQSVHSSIAVVFVPVTPAHPVHIRAGNPVRLQIGTQGQPFTTTVDVVEPAILGPNEIQQRYAFGSRLSSLITDPSIVVSIKLGPAFSSPVYAGSLINAQIQVDSTSVLLSLFGTA